MKFPVFPLFAFIVFFSCKQQKREPRLEVLETPTGVLLQAISIVDNQTAWISGHEGQFVRTLDGGGSWELFKHPTGDTLQFRDIYGMDAETAILMSAGHGPLSRIFTFSVTNGWKENFVMTDSIGFLNSIDFWDDQKGIAYGDAIDEFPFVLLTTDGGETWIRSPLDNIPKAGKEEGGFAASGTCVITGDNGKAWVATAAGGNCRVLITEDHGASWKAVETPLEKGVTAGNATLSHIDNYVFVAGGDIVKSREFSKNHAFSKDGGLTWQAGQPTNLTGAFYGSAITESSNDLHVFVCQPNGVEYSPDMGKTWNVLDTLNYWAVAMHKDFGYLSGKDGRISKITL